MSLIRFQPANVTVSLADIFFQRKERRSHSLNRNFYADYIGLDEKPLLKTLVGKREKVDFAQTVTRYDKKFKVGRSGENDQILLSGEYFLLKKLRECGWLTLSLYHYCRV